jgi:hypothetical protein
MTYAWTLLEGFAEASYAAAVAEVAGEGLEIPEEILASAILSG